MQQFNLDYIEKLIYDFYNSSEGHTDANKHLTLYQVSKESWDFSWMLLQPDKSVEVQYYGASCLHLKISKYWSEIDSDEKILQLRSKLLDTVCLYMVEGRLRIVQIKLCVALASYIVHSIKNHWPTAINDLIENFQPHNLPNVPANKIINALITILNVIPEEFNSTLMSIGERNEVRNALISTINPVFSMIKTILEQQDESFIDIKQSAIKCFSNWSQNLGTLVISGDLYESNLMLILNMMNDEELVNYCVETLICIYSDHEIHKYPNTVLRLIEKIVKLDVVLNDAIKKRQSTIYSTLYNLFIHIGETHSKLLLDCIVSKVNYRDSILKLIMFILQCSATTGYYPVDETCSEQAFNFWYTLQDDIMASEQDRISDLITLFSPLYQSLIDTLIIKVQYPPDVIYENEWSNDDKESFRCYRQDIGDTFMYCYHMLKSSVFTILMNHFNVAINHLQNCLTKPNEKPWQHLEAVIFAFSSISEYVMWEDLQIFNLFQSLAQIPLAQLNTPRLTATIMEMFGAYCDWIYNNPNFLPNVLSFLVLGLKSDQIAIVSATMALKDITRECQNLILPYANELLLVCEECLRPTSNLKPKEKSRLMCTVGQVLSVTSYQVTMDYLNVILPPILQDLKKCLENNSKESIFSIKNDVISLINMLTMLFGTLDPELKQSDPEEGWEVYKVKYKSSKFELHPALPIFKEVLPLLINFAMHWPNEESVIEAISECLKKALINLLDHAKTLIMDILQIIHNLFSLSHQSSLLDLLKSIMILYSQDEELKQILFPFYKQICIQTVNYCRQDLKEKCSLIEEFFTVNTLLMKKIPEFIKESNNMDSVDLLGMFQLAANSLMMAEKPIVRAASNFLIEFIKKSIDPLNHNFSLIINTEGEFLLTQAFIVISGCTDSSKYNIECMSDIIFCLNQNHFDNFCRWLMNCFTQRDNFPSDKINKIQKENFTKLILREKKNKRKLIQVLSDLTLACRGISTYEYNQQQMNFHF